MRGYRRRAAASTGTRGGARAPHPLELMDAVEHDRVVARRGVHRRRRAAVAERVNLPADARAAKRGVEGVAGRQLLGHRRQRRRRLVVLHPAAADKLELAARDEPPDLLAAARALLAEPALEEARLRPDEGAVGRTVEGVRHRREDRLHLLRIVRVVRLQPPRICVRMWNEVHVECREIRVVVGLRHRASPEPCVDGACRWFALVGGGRRQLRFVSSMATCCVTARGFATSLRTRASYLF